MLIAIVAVVSFLTGSILIFILVEKRRGEIREFYAKRDEIQAKLDKGVADLNEKSLAIAGAQTTLQRDRYELNGRIIGYEELQAENLTVKRDLLNIDTTVRKLEMDRRAQAEAQAALDTRSDTLAERYLTDVEQWVGRSITANNYASCRQRLTRAIEWCEEVGFIVPQSRKDALFVKLKADYEYKVREEFHKEEQARMKARIREDQQREREVQRELERLERERAAIAAALAAALADAREEHSEEVERLRARLAEAEERGQRAISQAQLTKAGHIYVISNVGSFGDRVFKIGMTRRLEPMDRIRELGDASVPYPFDVHMMISCENAPSLENAIHREFYKLRLNKVNLRKEYFRVDIERIRAFVEAHHGEVAYQADAEALEYRQSLSMSEQDEELIEQVFEQAKREAGVEEEE